MKNNSSLINNNIPELFNNKDIIISGINNGIVKGFEIITVNGNDNGMINEINSSLFDNKNDHIYTNEINTNKKEEDKNKNKKKNKNKSHDKYRNDNTFIYIMISVIGINGMIIIILTLICLLGIESKNTSKYNEINDDKDADIVIVEKITLLNKNNLKDEEYQNNMINSLNNKKYQNKFKSGY